MFRRQGKDFHGMMAITQKINCSWGRYGCRALRFYVFCILLFQTYKYVRIRKVGR